MREMVHTLVLGLGGPISAPVVALRAPCKYTNMPNAHQIWCGESYSLVIEITQFITYRGLGAKLL